jgi:hypothetical protein
LLAPSGATLPVLATGTFVEVRCLRQNGVITGCGSKTTTAMAVQAAGTITAAPVAAATIDGRVRLSGSGRWRCRAAASGVKVGAG